ncbi:MAG: bifunctional demethylmenaquinone methyltransferase/2-methoxy-6-polyprenyl-1,4-benzoquinol methylase UbiE [Candidatus Hydrogenedentales bacterium]|jgi:demethylmenaquinone methyltransferase/2-methoxy-6-polyprenyl-1,4-benzoquinol methylase
MDNTQVTANRNRIRIMFDAIAFRYDFLNRLLSFRQDVRWRRFLLDKLPQTTEKLRVLDLASGTGDVLLALLADKRAPKYVVGADISAAMLQHAQAKVRKAGVEDQCALTVGAAESLSFADESFDAVTVAFGVRNFSDRPAGLSEMHRVLRRGGCALILELSLPPNMLMRALYLIYFRATLPLLAGLFSKQRAAYHYLNRSVEAFPAPQTFCAILEEAGFQDCSYTRFTFGVAALYVASKAR